jgi:hypothetical protein
MVVTKPLKKSKLVKKKISRNSFLKFYSFILQDLQIGFREFEGNLLAGQLLVDS